jgi:hypothetical protein
VAQERGAEQIRTRPVLDHDRQALEGAAALAIARATTPQKHDRGDERRAQGARLVEEEENDPLRTIVKKPAPAMQRADGGWPSSDRPAAIPVRIRRPIRSPSRSANRAARAASPASRRNPAPATRSSASALAYAQPPRTAGRRKRFSGEQPVRGDRQPSHADERPRSRLP